MTSLWSGKFSLQMSLKFTFRTAPIIRYFYSKNHCSCLFTFCVGAARFRPNIVIGGAGVPWAEDTWERIQVGANTSNISLVSKCTRCLVCVS